MRPEVRLARGLLLTAAVLTTACDRGGGAAPSGDRPGGGAAGGAPQRVVPVLTATVAKRDVPVYLEGLGTVVAERTVTVRPQVDGRLLEVRFREGQAVKRGDVLALIDDRPFRIQLRQAEGALQRDIAQLANARRNVERNRELVAQKLIAQQQVDDQETLAAQLAGTVEIDRAAVETANLNLEYARITSPVDGVTGVRAVDAGNLVHQSDPNGIVVVTALDTVSVLFSVPQDVLPDVAAPLARGEELEVEVFGRDGSSRLAVGKLAVIDNQINAATATARLKALVPNPKRVLWPNAFVKARLRLDTEEGALVMPATALQRGPNGTFVYVMAKDQTVSVRTVKVKPPRGELVVIEDGLVDGEVVVVDGQSQLRAGSKVAPKTPGGGGGREKRGSGSKSTAGAAGAR